MKVDPNLNVVLTACLTVYVGCYRSVKPTPPSVSTASMFREHIQCFLHDQYQVLLMDVYLCRRQCQMSMPCASRLLEVRCFYHCFYYLSSYPKTWLTLCWHATSLFLESLLYRKFYFRSSIIVGNIVTYLLDDVVISSNLPFALYRATLLPAIKRFLPTHWNDDAIIWRFPYFCCMWPYFQLTSEFHIQYMFWSQCFIFYYIYCILMDWISRNI